MFNNIPLDEHLHSDILDQDEGDGMQNVEIQKYNRLKCPITLTQGASFDDIKLHALLRQRLSISTVEKRLRYARFMESHMIPVDFRDPTIENFIYHMDYREQIEQASPHALIHEWKTMRMFLKAYGLPIWDYKPPTPPKSNKKILPFPETVREFWHYKYDTNRYQRKLIQYMFFIGFNVGMRIPSEIANLKTTDIIFNKNGSCILTITETKKHNSERTIILPYELSTDPHHKSLKNWLTSWRPLAENQHSDNFLFIQSSGKPFSIRHLGHKLSNQGKKIWPYFHPYDMRHWCAIAKLIEQKINTGTFDCYPVKNWLGHETIQTTMNYIKYAEQYFNQTNYDWLKRVLRHPTMEDSTLKNRQTPKKPLFRMETLREKSMGLKRPNIGYRRESVQLNTILILFRFESIFFFFFFSKGGIAS